MCLGLEGCSQNDKPGGGDDEDAAPPVTSGAADRLMSMTFDQTGGFVYVGGNHCDLWKCDPKTTDSCEKWGSVSCEHRKGILSMVASPSNEHVYLGLNSGELWRCNTTEANDCQRLDSASRNNSILDLAYNPDDLHIYATPQSSVELKGFLWRCDEAKADACSTLHNADATINAVVYNPDNGYMYLAEDFGYIRKCNPTQSEQCDTVHSFDDQVGPVSLVFSEKDGFLYAGFPQVTIQRCGATSAGDCVTLLGPKDPDPGDPLTQYIDALAVNQDDGALFAGDSLATLWKCPQGTDACTSLVTLPDRYGGNTNSVSSLAYVPSSSDLPSGKYCADYLSAETAESICESTCAKLGLAWNGYWGSDLPLSPLACQTKSQCGCDNGTLIVLDGQSTLWRCGSEAPGGCRVLQQFF